MVKNTNTSEEVVGVDIVLNAFDSIDGQMRRIGRAVAGVAKIGRR